MKELPLSYDQLMEKIAAARRGASDLSTEEDLSIAVMNLISIEEHLFFTAGKTGDEHYLDLGSEVREMRKSLLQKMISRHEGETWCIAKHLLAATMRLMEVATKLRADGKKVEAGEAGAYAHRLYALFWGLRLKLINLGDIKKEADDQKPWTLQDIARKLVDCCDE